MFRRWNLLSLAAILTIPIILFPAGSFSAPSEPKKEYRVEDKPYEELNKMEIFANQARDLYWKGEYQKSIDIYTNLTMSNHPSTPLYFNERAQCHLALGNLSDAERDLRNVDNFFLAYNSAEREEKALSSFGEEAKKIYIGDPYERATNYLLLSLIYITKEDYENALAACKSGILAASDAKDNKDEGNYTLLQLLEMKLLSVIGKSDGAAQYREFARKSYINTHPEVRDLYSERLDKLALLAMSEDERVALKIKETPVEIKASISAIDEKIAVAERKVNADKDLGALLTGEYNVLIVLPAGKGPYKFRKGKDGHFVMINTESTPYLGPSVFVNGSHLPASPIREVANINYQASTRGGRKMDAILNGKAAYRGTTVSVGQFLTELGNQAGGLGGLAIALIGVAAQGVGGAMTPEADTRCWRSLPAGFEVYALNLPEGEHDIQILHRTYFELQGELKKKVVVSGPNKLTALIAPPSTIGRYSEIVESAGEAKRLPNAVKNGAGNIPFLITPPLGLKKIDRFPSVAEGEKPEAVAPDWKRITRRVQKKMEGLSIQAETVSHQALTKNYDLLTKSSPLAFQVEIENIDLKKEKDDKVYSMRVTFTTVETVSGRARHKETLTGVFRKTEKDKSGSTDAYYKCFDDAFEKYLEKNPLSDQRGDKSEAVKL